MAGGLAKRLQAIAALGDVGVSAGLQGEGSAKGRSTEAELVANARRNEYGLDGVPERPAFRTTAAQNGPDWAKRAAKAAQLLAGSGDEAKTFREIGKIGKVMVRDVKGSIRTGAWVPNAPSTIARKTKIKKSGKNKGQATVKPPLIDTGQTVRSIRAALELSDGTKVLL